MGLNGLPCFYVVKRSLRGDVLQTNNRRIGTTLSLVIILKKCTSSGSRDLPRTDKLASLLQKLNTKSIGDK
jgi:hypothetical protein